MQLLNVSAKTYIVIANSNASIAKEKVRQALNAVKRRKDYGTLYMLAIAWDEYEKAANKLYLAKCDVLPTIAFDSPSYDDICKEISNAALLTVTTSNAAIAVRKAMKAYLDAL
jgi:hypothetical protein